MPDRFAFTTVAHHGRALLGPLSRESVDELLAPIAPAPPPGARAALLDVGCGKGEILLRAMARLGASGTGVEPNPTFAAETRSSAHARGLTRDLTLFASDLAQAPVPHGGFDAVICTGSTHAFGGYAQALAEIPRFLRWRGWALIGVGYWRQPPQREYLESFGGQEDELSALEPTLAAPFPAGWNLVARHDSTLAEWDDYEQGYAASVRRYLAARPSHPDAEAMRERIDTWSAAYERWGRDTLGFVTMVLRR